MILRRKLELAAVIAVALAGCNALIDNEPGQLDENAAASRAGASDASTRDRDSSSQDDPSASQVSGGGPTKGDGGGTIPPPTGGCGTGSKKCGDLCVSIADPLFGCAAAACTPCALPNATAACVNGACAPAICTPGYGDCDAIPANGCETDLTAVTSCGACGVVCKNAAHGAGACSGGVCTLACAPGFGDCNQKLEDGCEKNLTHDKNNCGACGTVCIFGRCENNACVW